jgi:hypothetical protein
VLTNPQPDRLDRRHDGRRVLRLDGDRPGDVAVGRDVGHFRRAAIDLVAHAPLVHLDGTDEAARPDDLVEELVQRERRSVEIRQVDPQRVLDRLDVGDAQREVRLEHRLPALEARGVDLAQGLDVHEATADLDGLAVGGQEIELVALLDSRRLERRERLLGRPEVLAERAPLPARDDRRHVMPRPSVEDHDLEGDDQDAERAVDDGDPEGEVP